MNTTLATYVHDIAPYAFHIGSWGVHWYGLSYLAGFVVAFLLIRHVTKVGRSTVKPAEVMDMIVTLAMGAVIGGRVGYCLFYRPDLLITFENRLPYWGLLAINEGGMASHGGILGVVIASWIYARKHKHSWPHLLDLAAFGTPVGLCLGRLANFVNGELFGRPCPADFPLAVKFPQEMFQWTDRQADALIGKPGIALELVGRPGEIIQKIQQGDAALRIALAPYLTPRYPSQLFESFAEGVLLMVILLIVWRRPRKPLALAGWFLGSYAVLRIICEFFRAPDFFIQGKEFAHWGITRGQLLSLLPLVIGMALIGFGQSRDVDRMGGWRRGSI